VKRLSGWDSLLLSSETPNVHQHTVKVAVVDTSEFAGEPTFDAFRKIFRTRLSALEPLRYELVDIPLHLHRPMWRECADIDMDYHVRRLQVPAPGGRRGLDEAIGQIASTSLDRRRPLWVLYFAEGVAPDRVAVIGKVHHALADGVASANLMARAMQWPGFAAVDGDVLEPEGPPATADLLRCAGLDHVERVKTLPAAIRDGAAGVYRLQRRSRHRRRHAELADQFSPPPTFLNHKLSAGRTFASATLSLDEVKATSKDLGVTINDLVLAVAAGGLRRLLLDYQGRADKALIASVPAATDTSGDRITGNALATMLVSLPVQVPDPLERVKVVQMSTRIAKEDNELLGPTTVGQWLEFVPPMAVRTVFRWTSRREAPNQLFNVIVSNVPGPRQRGRIAGAVVTELYSVGPLAAGSALNMTVWSYADQLNISVLSDDQTLRDTHDATDAFTRAFAEIREAAGLGDTTTEVGTALPQAAPTSG
jgi:diacylglycerol O-acyltransferase